MGRNFTNSQFWDNLWKETFSRNHHFGFSLCDKPYLKYLFQRYFISKNNLKILDIGCGANDNFKSHFNYSQNWLINLDISHIALLALRKRITSGFIPINFKSDFIQGDILNLPLKENLFDLVICNQCFHYFSGSNRRKALDKIIRVCKKAGHIIISVKNKYSLQILALKFIKCLVPVKPFTYTELKKELQQKQIEVIELFSNIKIPKISYSSRFSIFLNQRYKKSKIALLFGMDIVLIAKKVA